jgi:hypothetical protein
MPMPSSPKSLLLQQMAAITCMERGKLSTYRPKGRAADAGPYHKLQHWQDGKNQTRHVSADELPQVEAALAGYEKFEELTGQYAEVVIGETRAAIADSKKNSSPRKFTSRKRRKSSS